MNKEDEIDAFKTTLWFNCGHDVEAFCDPAKWPEGMLEEFLRRFNFAALREFKKDAEVFRAEHERGAFPRLANEVVSGSFKVKPVPPLQAWLDGEVEATCREALAV